MEVCVDHVYFDRDGIPSLAYIAVEGFMYAVTKASIRRIDNSVVYLDHIDPASIAFQHIARAIKIDLPKDQ